MTDRSTEVLAQLTYAELYRIAARYMHGQRRDHTLQPTALVHEAYLRLARARPGGWESRTEFVAMAATTMRHVLVDCARRRRAARHNPGRRITLVDGAAVEREPPIDVLALDEGLAHLMRLDPRSARVVELRYFAGLEVEEIAGVLGISSATVKRDWRFAKAFLRAEMGSCEAAG